MYIYLVNMLLIIVYAILIKDKKKFVILVSLQLFLILALRDSNLGVDLINYSNGYYYIKELSFLDMIGKLNFFKSANLNYPYVYESGYVFFNWIIAQFNINFHGFLMLCALINIISFSYFIYKYSEIPWLSYIILCCFGIYTYFFGVLRQSISLSIFLWSVHYLLNNKKFKSVLLFIISFLFHRSILIMFPFFYLIKKKKIKKKEFIILMILTIPFILFSKTLYFKIIYPIMAYFGKGYIGHEMQINNLIIFLYIIAIAIAIFANFNDNANNKIFNVSILVFVISVYIEIIGMYNDNFARTMQICNTFLLISIPNIIKQYNNQRNIIFIKFFITVLLTIFLVYSLKDSVIIPYEFEKNNLFFE